MPRVCLQFVIVVFPDHAHLLFFIWSFALDNRNMTLLSISKCLLSVDHLCYFCLVFVMLFCASVY